jgi:hypothetical protein
MFSEEVAEAERGQNKVRKHKANGERYEIKGARCKFALKITESENAREGVRKSAYLACSEPTGGKRVAESGGG